MKDECIYCNRPTPLDTAVFEGDDDGFDTWACPDCSLQDAVFETDVTAVSFERDGVQYNGVGFGEGGEVVKLRMTRHITKNSLVMWLPLGMATASTWAIDWRNGRLRPDAKRMELL